MSRRDRCRAGVGDGTYELGEHVAVGHGQARLVDGDSLAGSTLTMDRSLRYAINAAHIAMPRAVAGCSTNPARTLSLCDAQGTVEIGTRADLVHLDDRHVQRVMTNGRWQQPCWSKAGTPAGSRPAKRRAVLVVSADTYNASRLATLIAVVITPNTSLALVPGRDRGDQLAGRVLVGGE